MRACRAGLSKVDAMTPPMMERIFAPNLSSEEREMLADELGGQVYLGYG